MSKTSTTPRSFWLTILAFTLVVNLTMLRLTYLRQVELKSDLTRSAWSGMLALCLLIVILCIWLMINLARNKSNIFGRLDHLQFDGSIWRIFGAIIFLAIVFLIPFIKFNFQIGQDVKNPIYDPVLLLLSYYWACWWCILIAMTALKVAFQTTWQGGFASALVLMGIAYETLIRFNAVTDYPLSMGWSEGSRYYYASLFFSKWIYGEQFPLSTLHPSRYLLQSFPFLFPSLGLFAHRFWQFLLWIGLTTGASIAVTKRIFADGEKAVRWLAAGWLFLFLLQVGVYYHLEVMVILPLLYVSPKKPWQTLSVVILSSIWAGISRVNWFPMPAMIAIAIYLLETPFHSSQDDSNPNFYKKLVSYLSQPALWAITGIISALLSQWAYVNISGNAGNAEAFTTSFTSDLLWYRLWPNQNHLLGIIPGILIASGPLIITLALAVRGWKSLHVIRWLGLIGMVVTLFAGSAVVSTKIGGGGDLHNMDTYAVLVSLIVLYFFSGRAAREPGEAQIQVRPAPIYTVAVIIPILFLIPALSPYPKYNEGANRQAHQQLVNVVTDISKDGPVLFISDRQLIALGDVKIPLVYDYEVVTLMEMAMAGNQTYLQNFYNDLANHRFAAIVAGRQILFIKQECVFAEENNVWNTYVSPYILCYYESSMTIEADQTRLEIYVPRTQTGVCPSGN
ncbi:MAG: hypothetical protein FIB03_12570 [Anaerolineae bacterium]|nr:hypothetical protein [Anaerolineae bacterium]